MRTRLVRKKKIIYIYCIAAPSCDETVNATHMHLLTINFPFNLLKQCIDAHSESSFERSCQYIARLVKIHVQWQSQRPIVLTQHYTMDNAQGGFHFSKSVAGVFTNIKINILLWLQNTNADLYSPVERKNLAYMVSWTHIYQMLQPNSKLNQLCSSTISLYLPCILPNSNKTEGQQLLGLCTHQGSNKQLRSRTSSTPLNPGHEGCWCTHIMWTRHKLDRKEYCSV